MRSRSFYKLRKVFDKKEVKLACRDTNYLFVILFLKFVKIKGLVGSAISLADHEYYKIFFRTFFQNTIYPHFCEGIDALSCSQTSTKFFSKGVCSMIDVAREDEVSIEACQQNTRDKLSLLELISGSAYPRGSIKFMPIKVSGIIPLPALLRAAAVINSISYETAVISTSLPPELAHLIDMQGPIVTICHMAAQNGISILLDAEPSHLQPVIEFLGHCLSRQFNSTSPVVYSTYQCYLKQTPYNLYRDQCLAEKYQYIFAVKLVRGAYVRSEIERAVLRDYSCPLLTSKSDVDDAYNIAMHRLLLDIAEEKRVAVMLATHNRDSVEHAVGLMSSLRIPPSHAHVSFALIKGINTHLAYILAKRRYNVNVLLMCGEFDVLFPWLRRRLDENQDIFGAAQQEYQCYSLINLFR